MQEPQGLETLAEFHGQSEAQLMFPKTVPREQSLAAPLIFFSAAHEVSLRFPFPIVLLGRSL